MDWYSGHSKCLFHSYSHFRSRAWSLPYRMFYHMFCSAILMFSVSSYLIWNAIIFHIFFLVKITLNLFANLKFKWLRRTDILQCPLKLSRTFVAIVWRHRMWRPELYKKQVLIQIHHTTVTLKNISEPSSFTN